MIDLNPYHFINIMLCKKALGTIHDIETSAITASVTTLVFYSHERTIIFTISLQDQEAVKSILCHRCEHCYFYYTSAKLRVVSQFLSRETVKNTRKTNTIQCVASSKNKDKYIASRGKNNSSHQRNNQLIPLGCQVTYLVNGDIWTKTHSCHLVPAVVAIGCFTVSGQKTTKG